MASSSLLMSVNSQEFFRKIVENAPDGLLIADCTKRKNVFANKRICSALGYSEKEMLNLTLKHMHPKECADTIETLFEEQITGKITLCRNVPLLRKDEKVIYCDINSKHIELGDRNFLVLFFRDAGERRKAEDELRKERDFSQNIINTAQTIILILDTDGKIASINPYMEKLSGYKSEEVKGNDWFSKFLPEKNRENTKRTFKRAISDVKTQGNIHSIITKSGKEIFIEWYDTTLKDKSGKVIGLLSTGQDITPRKKAEQELKNSEQKYRNLIQMAPDSIITLNERGMITSCNDAIVKLSGFEKKELIGEQFSKLAVFSLKDIPRFTKLFARIWNSNRTRNIEFGFIHKDGTQKWASANTTLIPTYGKDAEVQVILRDITDKKIAEEQLKKKLMRFKIEDGRVYLVPEETAICSVHAFEDLVKAEYRGIVISRKIKEDFKTLTNAEFEYYWLADSDRKETIYPDLSNIIQYIEGLEGNRVLYLDVLEFFYSRSIFCEVITFVQKLKDLIYLNNLVCILPVDPRVFGERELRMLKNECSELQAKVILNMQDDMIKLLKFVMSQNSYGVKPSFSDVTKALKVSKPTARKNIRLLVSKGYLVKSVTGRTKVVEITEKARILFE